jgi:DNA-directed RNA polymerase subunit F
MSSPTVLEETSIPNYAVKEALLANQKEGELNFRANKTLEYLNAVPVVKKKDGEKAVAELMKLEIPRFKDVHAHKLVDAMPVGVEEVKSVLSAYTITLSKENLDRIQEVLSKI